LLISDVVLQNQDGKYEEARKIKEAVETLKINAQQVPQNEFDDNNAIVSGAFPWIFPFGLFGRIDAAKRELICRQFNDRIAAETTLLFLLFNQMQRHRVTHNIAHGTKEDLDCINELRNDPNFQAKIDDAISDKPTEEGMQIRRTLLGAVHKAEKKVPFSRSEMDNAYVHLLSMLRFFGAPTFFVTISPSVVDNSFGLKVSIGVEGFHKQEYTIRSSLVFRTPIRSALFFEHIMKHLEEQIIVVNGEARGVFGLVRAYSRTNECQGRTLLHAHYLFWTDLSPEYIQQLYKKGKGDILKDIFAFLEQTVTTKMDEEYHEWSQDLWDKKQRAPNPGLEESCQKLPLWSAVHKEQMHRQHKDTCWSKHTTTSDRCRLAMPAGRFPQETQMIRVSLDENGKAIAELNPSPESVPCAHVFGCECKSFEDISKVGKDPIIVEMNRPTVFDQLVTSFTPQILEQTFSNTNTSMISTAEQASAIALYQIKYNSKTKFPLASALASVITARKKASTRGEEGTDRTFWNCFVNAASANHEVPATMAAFALLGGKGFETSCAFWFVFPWDVVKEFRLLDDTQDAEPSSDSSSSSSSDEESEEETQLLAVPYQQPKLPPSKIECKDGQIFDVEGTQVSLTQQQIYAARPERLEEMSYIAFCCMYEVEQIPAKESEQQRLERFELKDTIPISKTHRIKEKTNFPVPVLAGTAPPMLPQVIDSEQGKKQLLKWSIYWSVLMMPWRKKEDLEKFTPEAMLEWLMSSLRNERGPSEKTRALYTANVSIKWKQVKRHCRVLDAWRFRAADTRESAKKNSKAEPKTVNQAELMKTVCEYVATSGLGDDDALNRRCEQLRKIYCSSGNKGLPHDDYQLPHVDSVTAEAVAKAIEEYEESLACDDSKHGKEAKDDPKIIQPPIIQPIAELNNGQNVLRRMILESIIEKKQLLLFVQGEAGTGKSHAIRVIAAEAAKMAGCSRNTVRCLSPTGVAAENLLAGTVTIHRGFALHPKNKGVTAEPLKGASADAFFARYRNTRVFIIDEISMVSPSNFMKVDARLKQLAEVEQARYIKLGDTHAATQISKYKPFGGFTVVSMGDFRQIPPVGGQSLLKASLIAESNENAKKASHGGWLWRHFRMLQLKEQCRANEPRQQRRIDILRKGKMTAELIDDIAILTEEEAREAFKDAVYIVKTNKERIAINTIRAAEFATQKGVPIVQWKNELGDQIVKLLNGDTLDELCNATPDLTATFVQGAPAMVLRNINPQCGLSNGSNCELVGLAGLRPDDTAKIAAAGAGDVVNLDHPPTHVLVSVPALKTCEHMPRVIVDGKECVPLELSNGEIEVGHTKLSFSSHHVTLAFAVTMHKVQGKTLEKAIICLANHEKRWKPTFEQLLVAITRVRQADDLRFFPSLCSSDRNFRSLQDLTPNADVTKWFEGKFDDDGYRIYEETPEKLSKKQSSKKSLPLQLEPAHTKFQKTEQSLVHPTNVPPESHDNEVQQQDEQQQEETPAQEWNDILALWGGARPFRHIAQYIHEEGTIEEVEHTGDFIDIPAIEATLGSLKEPIIPYLNRYSPWNGQSPVFATMFKIPRHFVAMKVDLTANPPVFSIFDSSREYTSHHQAEKDAEIACIRAKIGALTGNANAIFVEELVQQQTENDCAIHTVNNCLRMMLAEDKQVILTRTTLGKLLRTFL